MRFIEPSFKILSEDFTRENVLSRIEIAARTCYKSEDKICEGSAAKMLNNLIKRGHEAMIEHAPNLSVRFICDRGITHELVRHRLFSFAQESTRYVNYSNKGMQFIIPEWVCGEDRKTMLSNEFTDIEAFNLLHKTENIELVNLLTAIESTYNHYVNFTKWALQQARAVIPNCIKTEIVVTGNVREWRNCFKLRTEQTAHPQMREIMIPLILKLNEDIPELWEDIVTKNSLTDWKPMYKL
ncbi:MAG: FAD-dependent thymidylate synthase [Ruminococcus flavefaciens]|nr:FAD-dependent thymidylate synthase [Ruminococcus flavefaciens]MCM1361048.1 FAD-dependent thymidylate synthase [Clostridiales bacterium]